MLSGQKSKKTDSEEEDGLRDGKGGERLEKGGQNSGGKMRERKKEKKWRNDTPYRVREAYTVG